MAVDFIKAISEDQTYISRLLSYAKNNLQKHTPQNKNYICFSNGSGRFRLEFRKVIYEGKLEGFRNVEVCFSPHYLFNNDLHNGNDLIPADAIKTIRETFLKIGILECEMQHFRVAGLEYGLNLNTCLKIEGLIDGVLYTKRKPFKVPDPKYQYSKISDTTNYKKIKAYAKGIQFLENPEYRIDRNIFRFEVKTKQSKNIRKLGINSVADLLNPDVYITLFQSILDEWENVLVVNPELKDEVNTPEYWKNVLVDKYRHQFRIKKEKYYEDLDPKHNLHHLIKCKMIDKIVELQNCTNSTHGTPLNKENDVSENILPLLINVEFVQSRSTDEVNVRRCRVTNLDISMQKKNSIYLCETGVKFYNDNDPKIFEELREKYLTAKMRGLPIARQFYYIAHNIRNIKSNYVNNQKRFERRTYHPNQLQINFNY